MGEEVKVLDVQAENGGTIIQIDFIASGKKDRMFVKTRDILKSLNNVIYYMEDKRLESMGFELVDPENYTNPNLID